MSTRPVQPAEHTPASPEARTEPSSGIGSAHVSRRAYSAPRLRHLGSVRELTLGATSGIFADGGATRRRTRT